MILMMADQMKLTINTKGMVYVAGGTKGNIEAIVKIFGLAYVFRSLE